MKNKILKKIALCSLISLGTVAFGISLIGCGTSKGAISFSINGEEGTSFTKAAGSIFTIEATYIPNDEEETSTGVASWSWSVDESTGIFLSGTETSSLTVTTNVAGTYVFTATYAVDDVTFASNKVTINLIEADAQYELHIDESDSLLTYNQGSTFRKEYITVYRDLIQLEEISSSVSVTEYDIQATVDGATFRLEDGDQLTVVGTYNITISFDGLTATTTLTVLEDVAWQFSSTLGEYLLNDDYYINSGELQLGLSDGVMVNYKTDEAYTVSSGVCTYLTNYTATSLRRFKIGGYDSDGISPTSATASDFVWMSGLTSSGGYYYTGYGAVSSISGYAYYNGFLLGSDWSSSYGSGIYVGERSYYDNDGQLVATENGFIGGTNFASFFLELGGYGYYQDYGYTARYALISESDTENYYNVYIDMYYGTSNQGWLKYTLGLGVVDNSVVLEVASTYTTSAVDKSVYEDEILEAGLDVTAYGSEYTYTHQIIEDSTHNTYTYSEVTINDKYVDIKEYDGGTTGMSYTVSSQSGLVVENSSSTIYDGTLYPYTVSGANVTADNEESTTYSDNDLSWSVLGREEYLGLKGSSEELLWTYVGTTVDEGNTSIITNSYRFYGYALGMYLGSFAYYHGEYSSALQSWVLNTIYVELNVTGYYENDDFVVTATEITPYMAYTSVYEWAFAFGDVAWFVDPTGGEDSTLETYISSLNSGANNLSTTGTESTSTLSLDVSSKNRTLIETMDLI